MYHQTNAGLKYENFMYFITKKGVLELKKHAHKTVYVYFKL